MNRRTLLKTVGASAMAFSLADMVMLEAMAKSPDAGHNGKFAALKSVLDLQAGYPDAKALGLGDKEVFVYPVNSSDKSFVPQFDERFFMYAVQGMINRGGPHIYMHYLGLDHQIIKTWTNRLESKYGYKLIYKPYNVEDFIRTFAPYFNGIVLYDKSPSHNHFLAANVASHGFCMPVSKDMYERYRQAFGDVKIVCEIEKDEFTFKQIYDWMLKEIRPLCDNKQAYSVCASFDDYTMGPESWEKYMWGGVDHAFYRKMFIFNVTGRSTPSGNVLGGPNAEGYVGGDAVSWDIFSRIMESYQYPANIWGWNTVEAVYSIWGHRMLHDICFDSGSFWTQVSPVRRPPYHQDTTPKIDKPQDKVYIAFLTNEGDTVSHDYLFHWGAWLKKERGQIPLNWCMNPYYFQMFPAIYEYYMDTKTDNDYFLCAPSGSGYARPDIFTTDMMRSHVKDTADAISKALNMREIKLWYCDNPDYQQMFVDEIPDLRGLYPKRRIFEKFGRLLHLDGKNGKVPVIYESAYLHYANIRNDLIERHSDDYWELKENFYKYMEELYSTMPKPCYIEFYCMEVGLPKGILEASQKLDGSRFEIIDMGTMAHLAAQSPSNIDSVPVFPAKEKRKPVTGYLSQGSNRKLWKSLNDADVSTKNGTVIAKVSGKKPWGGIHIEDLLLPKGTAWMEFDIVECTGESWCATISPMIYEGGLTGESMFLEPLCHTGRFTVNVAQAIERKINAGEPLSSLNFTTVDGRLGSRPVFAVKNVRFLTDEQFKKENKR